MKQVFSIFSVACVAFFTLFLSTTTSSCSKKGDTGPKGDTGTANVMYSSWMNLTFSPNINSSGDTTAWTYTIAAPKITKQILDSGVVKVYWNANSTTDPAIFSLPLTDYYGLSGVQNINLYFSIGKIFIYATEDPSTFTSGGTTYGQFRYVIIPGGKPTGRSAVNLNSYKDVQAYFDLPN